MSAATAEPEHGDGPGEPLRVAVLGVGVMGGYHVDTLERIAEADLVAVADPDEARAAARIGRRPVAWHPDWRSVLERDDVEAVTIASPSVAHAEMAMAALQAGKHVLVEKPIATSLPDALRLASAAAASGLKLMVGHVERFNPAVVKIRDLLADGRAGEVFRVHTERVGPLPPRIADAGVAMDLATHDLDLVQHLLGRDVTHVHAEGARFRHDAHEDMLTCLLRFGDDGPFGLLDVNWLTPEKRRALTIIGADGMLRADLITQDVFFVESDTPGNRWEELATVRGDAEGALVRFALTRRQPLEAELQAFCRCVRFDEPEPVDAYEGARALAAALAVRESAASGRSVDLLDMPRRPARPTEAHA